MNRAPSPTINSQSIGFSSSERPPSGELQPCTANRSDEDLSRRYALSQPASVLLSATQQVQRQLAPSACASCYRRLVAGDIDRKTAPLRPAFMAPDNKKGKPLGIRHNSVLSSNVQSPTYNIRPPAFSTSSHISESYLSSSNLGTTKERQDAICSLLPCNTAANLGYFFGQTRHMKYCASHVQSNFDEKEIGRQQRHLMCCASK